MALVSNFGSVLTSLLVLLALTVTGRAAQTPRRVPPVLETKAIVLPYERAHPIRACTDCTVAEGGSTASVTGSSVCRSVGCQEFGSRCSHLSSDLVTVSAHRCKFPNGEFGASLFCCKKGSREALNLLTLRAAPNQYPHQVYIAIRALDPETRKFYHTHCGGSVIDRSWILSAAHCFRPLPSHQGGLPLVIVRAVVVVGQNHVQIPEQGNRYEVDLENSIIHPLFSYNPLVNDISLLRLQEPLSFNGFVNHIRLANSSFVEQGFVEIIGYGKTDTHRPLNVLLTEVATIIDNGKCARLTKSAKPPTIMCVGGGNEAVPNQGDSGGPAICRNSFNEPILCGIVSSLNEHIICDGDRRKRLNIREGEALPQGCGYPPAIFTRVSKYYDWIVNSIA